VRLTTAQDAQARERGQAAAKRRPPPRRGGNGSYTTDEPGRTLELEPRHCRCTRPAVSADLDHRHGVVTLSCLTCGRDRAVLDRRDLAALGAAPAREPLTDAPFSA
jgi:hypothetical protein